MSWLSLSQESIMAIAIVVNLLRWDMGQIWIEFDFITTHPSNTDIATPSIAQLVPVLRPLRQLKLLDVRGTYADHRCLPKCVVSGWVVQPYSHICRQWISIGSSVTSAPRASCVSGTNRYL